VVFRESPRARRQYPGAVGAERLPLWVSAVEPGSVHDLTAAREHVLGALYWAASQLGLPTLADGGYDGAGIGVHTPVKQSAGDQVLDVDNRTHNALPRGLRCLGERGFAVLTGRWRTLRHITASPRKIGDIVKAALVLTHFEHGRLT
jgi:DDE superfamily endonuclease